MKILLDTQAFLWAITDPPKLSRAAKKIFIDAHNELLLSLASIWEIAIKTSIGKLSLKQPLKKFITTQLSQNRIGTLHLDFHHIMGVAALPFHHRDPFDRLLISQALVENIPILSCDKAFDDYDIRRLW